MIGERIKKMRKEKGLTIKQLGNLCGISEQNMGNYERGVRTPKLETIIKIANALEVNYLELLDTVPNELLTIKKLEKALDKACEELEHEYSQIYSDKYEWNRDQWKEWCLEV